MAPRYMSVSSLCVHSYMLNYSNFHMFIQFKCLAAFTKAGHVLFPQVCHSWHFNCKTASLFGRVSRVNGKRGHLGGERPCSPRSTRLGAAPV